MRSFDLKIVTPNGTEFDGQAEKLILRATTGEMGILADHADCVVPLAQGPISVHTTGSVRQCFCDSGIVTVLQGKATLLSATFQWMVKDK